MKCRITKKTSAPASSTERPDLRPQNETRPHGRMLASDGHCSEALKHWLQVESELTNARRGQRWINTFTP